MSVSSMKVEQFPARRLRFQRVRRHLEPQPLAPSPAELAPGVGETRISSAAPFKSDGFVFPRPQDTLFDAIIREPLIAANSTVIRTVFTQEERIKGGWIRWLGYAFSTPSGFFQVRTTILINGGTPARYIFKTVDAATGAYQGSLPTVQIGTVQEPTEVFIELPSNAVVQVRFVNLSLDESYSACVRLKGWSFA